MKTIKRYHEFNEDLELNESLKPFLKKIWNKFKDSDFFKKNFSKIREVYDKLESDVKKYVKEHMTELSEKDIKILKTYDAADLDIPTNETEGGNTQRKIVNILGLSTGSIGFISGIYSMVIAAIEESAYNASSWFIIFVVLMLVTGVINTVKPEKEDK